TVFVASQPTQLCVVVLSTAAPTFTSPLSLHDPLPISLAGTVTEGPTVAALRLLLASVTTAPPAGAPLLSVTVPVLPAGPVTAVRSALPTSELPALSTLGCPLLLTPL